MTSLDRFANRNSENSGFIGDEVIGAGKYKVVTKGTYRTSGEPAVDKFLKSGTTFSSDCFLDDVRSSEAALPYVAGFIEYIDGTTHYQGHVSIKLNMPQVWEQEKGSLKGQKMLREPYIQDFQKFNSNSGAALITAAVAQALSHFSYHASDGTELLCDLQGGKIGNSYVLSDVVMMSMSKEYGNTDLGPAGIENWLHSHRCTQFCSSSWKNWTGARQLIEPVFSTTTTFDVSTTAPKATEYVRVRPSQIYFTQDSIKNKFQDGHTLYETALQIARQAVGKRDIPMISVVRYDDGRLFTVDNRRLAVFRLLEMSDRVGTIKVSVVPLGPLIDEWNQKATTTNGGIIITVRGREGYRIGRNRQESRFPFFDVLRNTRGSTKEIKEDKEFSIFLAGFMDE